MSKFEEDTVREFLAASADGDGMGALAYFTDDASYHMNAWHPPHVGKAAIQADFERQRALWSNFRYDLISVASAGSVVITERLDTVFMMGRDLATHVVGVFEVTPEGKITSWREYFDMKEVEAQLADG